MNERTRQPVALSVEIAATRTSRRRGLLGRDRLDEASAMLLAPCTAVHTAGMRFAIDVVFVDRQGYAVKIVRGLPPWRIALAAGARAVIEMAAGSLRWHQVLLGDRLYLASASDTREPVKEPALTAETAETAEERVVVSAHSARSAVNTPDPTCSILRRLRDTSGTSVVEAAIITPLLLLLTFSIADFASLFYVYLALENGVSQASRYGVTGNLMDDPLHPGAKLAREDSIRTAMRQATPTLTLDDGAFGFSHMSPGASTWSAGTGAPSDIEKVTVDYTWNFLTPLLRPFFAGGQVHLTVDSAMKNEARFQ